MCNFRTPRPSIKYHSTLTATDGSSCFWEARPLEKSSPFKEWVPRDYLRDYFCEVQEDERHAIRYFVEQIRSAPVGPILCFGCGPTLHHVFLTAPHTSELVMADYLPRNLKEIDAWRNDVAGAHDWTAFVRYTLYCESGREPRPDEITARMGLLRARITALVPADAGLRDPLGQQFRDRFAVVLSPFCADSATDDKAVWARYSHNIASLVRPGGLMLTAALRRCSRYKVGERFFPSANVDASDLRMVLEEDFVPSTVSVEAREMAEHEVQGYTGILLARALKAESV